MIDVRDVKQRILSTVKCFRHCMCAENPLKSPAQPPPPPALPAHGCYSGEIPARPARSLLLRWNPRTACPRLATQVKSPARPCHGLLLRWNPRTTCPQLATRVKFPARPVHTLLLRQIHTILKRSLFISTQNALATRLEHNKKIKINSYKNYTEDLMTQWYTTKLKPKGPRGEGFLLCLKRRKKMVRVLQTLCVLVSVYFLSLLLCRRPHYVIKVIFTKFVQICSFSGFPCTKTICNL